MLDDSSPQAVSGAPEHFGRYRLVERIGVGGMGEVFKAYVEGYGATFVIKRIRPEKSERPEIVEMFCEEARVCALLSHPNIVEMYDFGQIGGAYFMALEYLRGRDLAAVVRALRLRGAAVPPLVAAYVAAEVARGLDHAHGAAHPDGSPAEIVHRDVSPSNVMLLAVGDVKVLDFGIAKVAAARSAPVVSRKRRIKGKLSYVSPEQVRNLELDGRSDVFSLGVVLWEMLVGRRLFTAPTEYETLRNVLAMPVPPPSSQRPEVPAGLDRVVARALERDRDARHPSAAALAAALDAARAGAAGRDGVTALLASLFGEAAALPRERMTGSFTADSISSLDGGGPMRLSEERAVVAEVIASVDGAAAPEPTAPPAARAARRRPLVALVVALGLAALALGGAWRFLSRAGPDPSRRAGRASAGR